MGLSVGISQPGSDRRSRSLAETEREREGEGKGKTAKARERGSAGTERRGGLGAVSLICILQESHRRACVMRSHANTQLGPPRPPSVLLLASVLEDSIVNIS